jgi:eukaryotic-like serine/threonine-protein kinase
MTQLPCPAAEWPRFSALLDQYLELDSTAREPWLVALPAEDAHHSERLRNLIRRATQRTAEDWLDRPHAADDAPGFNQDQRIGPWRLVRPLGAGGMGVVWLAARADGAYVREVALKLPHAHVMTSALRQHFTRERNILAGLSDPRIARFYDAGVTEQGQSWLALEYVEGTPITEFCQQRALAIRERVTLMREVAAAVQAAHARLVVHRDLKPANVLAAAGGQIKLLDFGIAKLLDDSVDGGYTQAGAHAASPDYAAPEQLLGGPIGVATDVFGLGAMLYELLTGQRPFAPRSRLGRLLDDRREAPLASMRVSGRACAELAGDLDAIVARAMETDPARRYQSVEAFSQDLERYLAHEPVLARRIGRWHRGMKFLRRHRRGAAILGALVLALSAGVTGVWWQAQRTAEEARRANAIRDFLVETFQASDPRIASDLPRGSITARALLDAGAARIESRFSDDPTVQIELLRTLADLYAQLGEDARYEELQALQLAKVRETYGPLHPNILEGAVESAQRTCSRGDRESCAARVKEADQVLKQAGDHDPEIRAQWWLARGLQLQSEAGQLEASGVAYANAVELYRKHNPRSRGAVTALHELAGYYNWMKLDFDHAIATYLEALALAQSLPERNDAELQTLYSNLGLVYQQKADFVAAAEAFRRSAEIAERTTGADFPTAWTSRSQAARTLHLAGEREAAHREYARLLPLLPTDGTYAMDVANAREAFGERLANEGRPKLGIPHLEAALAYHTTQGTFSFKARLLRRFLGEAYARAGRHADAGRLLKASLDEYLASALEQQQPVMAIRESWGRWLIDDHRPREAAAQFSAILAVAEGRSLAHVALAHAGLARIALAERKLDHARRDSETAMRLWSSVTGFRDVRMGPYIQRVHADVLAANGELAAAQQLEDQAAAASSRYDAPESATAQRRRLKSGL